MGLRNVTLELSGKAFLDDSEGTMRRVCQKMYRQWGRLIAKADMVSILLWIADGSEILEYTGDLQKGFEWGYWSGCANHLPRPASPTAAELRNTHMFPVKYRADASPRTYAWLKRLLEIIRQTGQEITGKTPRIGATFDNGPEFAISAFKFQRHREIANGHTLYPNSFVTCNSLLHADSQPYAAYPQGIPGGTSLGEFLGAQFREFSRDIGYDYIWLSNGMGFGTETWGITGALFDKERFYPERAAQAAESMLRFWRDFTTACPGVTIETRGSNFSAGTEMSTDAAPLRELYRDYKIAPPVNSPWAAINYNSGLEIAAWMSHVAELPDGRFPYRFYAHDPWFMNSPWLDRYGREPWDIYQPLSVCRIKDDGRVQTPDSVAILTVDDTLGNMPDAVPDETIPHLLNALECAPDAPGPLVWVYPFTEYSQLVRGDKPDPQKVFNEDMFIGEMIQAGAPVNTVISTANFQKVCKKGGTLLNDKIIIVPLSAYESINEELEEMKNVIFYGSIRNAPAAFLRLMGLENAAEITGRVNVGTETEIDSYAQGKLADVAYIVPQFCDGGLREVLAEDNGVKILATARQDGQTRILAMVKQLAHGGRIGFLRSVMPCDPEYDRAGCSFDRLPPQSAFPIERLLRHMLADFGWAINFEAFALSSDLCRTCVSVHDNSMYFSIFALDTSATMRVRTPYGAPLLNEMETLVLDGTAVWHPGKSWHKQARCYAKQQQASVIRCKIATAEYPCFSGRLNYYGFKDAQVRFFPPAQAVDRLTVFFSEQELQHHQLLAESPVSLEWEDTPEGRCVVLKGITGNLYFNW